MASKWRHGPGPEEERPSSPDGRDSSVGRPDRSSGGDGWRAAPPRCFHMGRPRGMALDSLRFAADVCHLRRRRGCVLPWPMGRPPILGLAGGQSPVVPQGVESAVIRRLLEASRYGGARLLGMRARQEPWSIDRPPGGTSRRRSRKEGAAILLVRRASKELAGKGSVFALRVRRRMAPLITRAAGQPRSPQTPNTRVIHLASAYISPGVGSLLR